MLKHSRYIQLIFMMLFLGSINGFARSESPGWGTFNLSNNTAVDKLIKNTDTESTNFLIDREIKGKVVDESGNPIEGVSVKVKGQNTGTATDAAGAFSLTVPDNARIEISFIGFQTQEITVGNNNNFTIVLKEGATRLDQVVVVGYGTQKKVNLTGAVSSIQGSDVITTKNENVQNMLTGKVSGVRVTQNTSEPGAFSNNFDIRGMGAPLVIIDGIPRTNDDFQRLDPNDIDNISVLKDASAAIYGVRAANGVVLVTTRKGTKNKLELSYSGSYSWQIPSGLPKTVNAIEYMTLRNERAM
ncbi:MAG TPA: carboxypeptidase-like regulatory domain-containing protein, partial [Chitinophagaceae bacterium]